MAAGGLPAERGAAGHQAHQSRAQVHHQVSVGRCGPSGRAVRMLGGSALAACDWTALCAPFSSTILAHAQAHLSRPRLLWRAAVRGDAAAGVRLLPGAEDETEAQRRQKASHGR